MPELPEVEVCRLGITPHLLNQQVKDVVVRHKQLRWPIPEEVKQVVGEEVTDISRRAKYLILTTHKGSIILHLGMSGTLRVIDSNVAIKKHDHFDLAFSNGLVLRLNDPRRFGAILWMPAGESHHEVLNHLGPEPLSDEFDESYLIEKAKNKATPVKTFLMNNKIVVGVGNIYANEALFQANIHPTTKAGKVTQKKLKKLVPIIKAVLEKAINQGGTTLKDFRQSDGKPGYFAQELQVYGRAGKPCPVCDTLLKEIKISGRSTVFCPDCQPK